jgi:predicted nuclease of predicted toxin-antitoxin system
MRILIDECLPRKLKFHLSGHEVETVPSMGWQGKKNGELLRLMTGKFDVFFTVDGNLTYQQNLRAQSMCIVLLRAPNTQLNTLMPLMPLVQKHLSAARLNKMIVVSYDELTDF